MIVAVFFIMISMSHAQSSKIQTTLKPAVPPTDKPLSALPDLIVKTPSWSSNPKAGEKVGMASALHITVLNQGSAPTPAGDSQLKITCQSMSGATCPGVLTGVISVQPLEPGMSMTYAWPPSGHPGKTRRRPGPGLYPVYGVIMSGQSSMPVCSMHFPWHNEYHLQSA